MAGRNGLSGHQGRPQRARSRCSGGSRCLYRVGPLAGSVENVSQLEWIIRRELPKKKKKTGEDTPLQSLVTQLDRAHSRFQVKRML